MRVKTPTAGHQLDVPLVPASLIGGLAAHGDLLGLEEGDLAADLVHPAGGVVADVGLDGQRLGVRGQGLPHVGPVPAAGVRGHTQTHGEAGVTLVWAGDGGLCWYGSGTAGTGPCSPRQGPAKRVA